MGLADRQYMRGSGAGAFSAPMWLVILVLNVVVFVAEYSFGPDFKYAVQYHGALSLAGLKHGEIWQPLTFQFLHGGTSHLLFNLISLWSFGRPVEMMLGRRKFLALYLTSGFVGGFVQILLGLAAERFGGSVVGASAGICGLIAAFALLFPEEIVYLMFILPVRAIYFLPIEIVLALVAMILPSDAHIAHGAHLGGILAGVAWVKFGWYQEYARLPWDDLLDRWRQWRPFRGHRRRRELVEAATPKKPFWPRGKSETPEEVPEEEFISREVDPILDKISEHGIQSLTDRERRILEAARRRMPKR